MTTHAESDGWAEAPVPKLSDPTDLLTALPALMGFVPSRSLVIVCLSGTGPSFTLGPTMRHDLAPPTVAHRVHPVMVEVVKKLAELCEREDILQAIAVIVDDTDDVERAIASSTSTAYGITHPCDYEALDDHVLLMDVVDAILNEYGTELRSAHIVGRIETDAPWASFFGDTRRGVLTDHRSAPVTLATVVGGKAIRGSREEIERLLDPAPEDVRTMVETAIDLAATRAAERTDLECMQLVLNLVQTDRISPYGPMEIAETAWAVERIAVRDMLLALAITTVSDQAQQLWIAVTRAVPEADRATAATLLGFFSYVRGEGPLAGTAFAAALTSQPDHNFASLLDTALMNAMRPDFVREVARNAYDDLVELGIALPPTVG
ncbi:hypothetical protein GCM10007304_23060 [Rhodococcoides trifolii]|uniref:DUF4192 domain-containing protein n=1 Tax=Rhodococcoides trifolii TaxID=908250 RepID=A0A917FW32_9NOCA|nr:DUF4192 domain-containing protein [Rhodococcus trifolii]GGG08359.1 hypothetical protein GCM10007304_23060 [Rhodococcus trifolii]